MKRVFAFCSVAMLSGWTMAVPLFDQGKTDWKIAPKADSPHSPIAYAAQELRETLKVVSGADFAIDPSASGTRVISIHVDPSLPSEGSEIVVVRLNGDTIELIGNQPRAALYAVYSFLKRELGVKWLWPGEDGAFVPKRTSWDVPKQPEWRYSPSIRYRIFHCCGDSTYRRDEYFAWAARNFVNGHFHGFNKPELEKYGFCNIISDHGASLHRKPDFFAAHPEYYAEVGGKRILENICFSSDGALKAVVDVYVERLRQRRVQPEMLGIIPKDNQDYCQCALCRKRSVSDNWFGFYNRLVTELRKRYPKLRFFTLAYQGYRDAPSFPLLETEFVGYASHERCNRHLWSNGNCPDNVRELKRMDGWLKTDTPIGHYAYEFDVFRAYQMFLPFFTLIDDEVNLAVRQKAVALSTEILVEPKCGPDIAVGRVKNRLPILFYAEKMWNASRTVDSFFDEVTKTAFGPAAADMKEYFRTMDAAWCRESDGHIGILRSGLSSARTVLTPETRKAADAALSAAESKLKAGDERSHLNCQREIALYRQWCETADEAAGCAVKLRLSRVAEDARSIPKTAMRSCPLVDQKGKASGVDVRMAWTDARDVNGAIVKSLFVTYDGVGSSDALSFALTLASGDRFAFSCDAQGKKANHVSQVGIEDKRFAPDWEVRREKGTCTFVIPAKSLIARLSSGEQPTVAFSCSGTRQGRWPVRDGHEISVIFTRVRFHDIPMLSCYSHKKRKMNKMVEAVNAQGGGFTADCADGPAEADGLVNASHRAFLLQGVCPMQLASATREAICKAVQDGGLILITHHASLETDKFFGDPTYATRPVAPEFARSTTSRRSTFVAEGAWRDNPFPHVYQRLLGGITPGYAQEPVDPKGWTVYARVKGASKPEVPYIISKPYGKGLVVVAGSQLQVSPYDLMANLWQMLQDKQER